MSLVAKYSLNGNANDSLGVNNGTATNVTWVDGKLNQAGSFNGSSSQINCGSSVINGGSEMSAFCWLRLNSYSDYFFINKDGVTSNREFVISTSTGAGQGFVVFVFTSPSAFSYAYSDATTRPANGTWCYVGFTRNSSGVIEIYVNGNPISKTQPNTSSGAINNTAEGLKLGYRNYGPSPGRLNGTMDEVEIYNNVLTPGEIKMKYLYYLGYI